MNTLIITLGNSEIQFESENIIPFSIEEIGRDIFLVNDEIRLPVKWNNRIGQEQWLIPLSSRSGGKIIVDNWNHFKQITKLPIIKPLKGFIIDENVDHIVQVVTDQDDAQHMSGDTVYYAQIVEKYLNDENRSVRFSLITIKSNVKDIDYQYRKIGSEFSDLFGQTFDADQFYLFAQGGIDQINHALTLQLIQRYKDKVHLLQKPEGEALKMLEFQNLFLKDLHRQKIIKHLEDFDFDKAAELIIDDQVAKDICQYASLRLNLSAIPADFYFDNQHIFFLGDDLFQILNFDFNNASHIQKQIAKLRDLVFRIRIDIMQKKYNEAIIRMFTLFENLFKHLLESRMEEPEDTYEKYYINNSKNTENKEFIEFIKTFPELYAHIHATGTWINNPNRKFYTEAYKFLTKTNRYKGLIKKVEALSEKRNKVAHRLTGISEIEFNNLFGKYSLTDFNTDLDSILKINGFGIYQTVRDRLLQLYQ